MCAAALQAGRPSLFKRCGKQHPTGRHWHHQEFLEIGVNLRISMDGTTRVTLQWPGLLGHRQAKRIDQFLRRLLTMSSLITLMRKAHKKPKTQSKAWD